MLFFLRELPPEFALIGFTNFALWFGLLLLRSVCSTIGFIVLNYYFKVLVELIRLVAFLNARKLSLARMFVSDFHEVSQVRNNALIRNACLRQP